MAVRVIIRLKIKIDKTRHKAFKALAALESIQSGMQSMTWTGDAQDLLVVAGQFDVVEVVSRLRKKLGYAQLEGFERVPPPPNHCCHCSRLLQPQGPPPANIIVKKEEED